MNILGTMYMIDESHTDLLRANLLEVKPGLPTIVLNLDEFDDEIEKEFPNVVQKASILSPPPEALYKEIDGEAEAFVEIYDEHLQSNTVMGFIASILYYLSIGGNVIIYTPADLETDSIYTNTLILFFFTNFGISIGTSAQNWFSYDPRYDGVIADVLYLYDKVDLMRYLQMSGPFIPMNDPELQEKLMYDLKPYCGNNGEYTEIEMYQVMKQSILSNATPAGPMRPAVSFDRPYYETHNVVAGF